MGTVRPASASQIALVDGGKCFVVFFLVNGGRGIKIKSAGFSHSFTVAWIGPDRKLRHFALRRVRPFNRSQ